MRVSRFEWKGEDPAGLARELRALQPPLIDVAGQVSALIEEVRSGGDAAVLRLEERFGGTTPKQLRMPDQDLDDALESAGEVREALELAAANISAVAESEVDADRGAEAELPAGQVVQLRSVPVAAAGAYVPGGAAAYPSTALMTCLPARAAGVERVAVASPPGSDGKPNSLVLAACSLAGASEVYAIGGVQAVAALALGTESVTPVDVVVGPGNAWVREAKRMISGERGIDSLAGPSELMVIAGDGADVEWIALDLCAQGEHGADSPLIVAAVERDTLDAIELAAGNAAGARPGIADAPLALVQVPDTGAAIELANAYAPEHLQLAVEDAPLLANRVTTAGCVFVGRYGATAFGDYVAGSNHVLPTGGAGRFSGPLGPGTFRRKISTVEVSAEAAAKLAPHVDTIARAEGFPAHGESAMIRSKS
jgi:histidinol dehydrogenase